LRLAFSVKHIRTKPSPIKNFYTPRDKPRPLKHFHPKSLTKFPIKKKVSPDITTLEGEKATIERFAREQGLNIFILNSARELMRLSEKKRQEVAAEIYKTFRKWHFD